MYVKELLYGLNPVNKIVLSTFENKNGYKKMLVEQNITIDSARERNFAYSCFSSENRSATL